MNVKKLKNYPRSGGICIFLFSLFISVWAWNSIIGDAENRTPTVYLPYGFATMVAFAALGFWFIVFGKKVQEYSRGLKGRKKNPADFLIISLIVGPGFIAYFLLMYRLSQMGYVLH